MAKARTDVPRATSDNLLHASRHTCCRCHEPRLPVEIHHINGDPSDHRPPNLAVLCRNCHGLVTAKGSLGRSISPGEVKRSKAEWEAACAADADEIDEPEEEAHDIVRVPSGGWHEWIYQLPEGYRLVVGFDSDVALNARIARQSDYRRWCADDPDAVCEVFEEEIYAGELEHAADRDNRYVFWLENDDDEDAIVEVDIAVWAPAGE